MLAFITTILLFGFFGFTGHALLISCLPRMRAIPRALLAPAVGVATVILPVFMLNRWGIPVKDFGLYLAIALFLVGGIVHFVKKPIFPHKQLTPFMLILLIGLLLAAWPMLLYGFDWVSFSNDDMANYALGATRFLNHPYLTAPDFDVFYQGKDYTMVYWYMHALGGSRAGSELMLAFVCAVTKLNAHQTFMLTIIALHIALLSAATAFVASFTASRKRALFTMMLLAISPMGCLGALYQLIGQVGGLGLSIASGVLLSKNYRYKNLWQLLGQIVPIGVLVSALLVWYPEILPFLGLSWFIYIAVNLFKNTGVTLKYKITPAILGGVICIILLNKYFLIALSFLIGQTGGNFNFHHDLSTSLFPYFLVPSGLAIIWGMIPLLTSVNDALLIIPIAAAIILSLWLAYSLFKYMRRNYFAAFMATIMVTVALILFFLRSDFGLYKMVMYLQPFIWCVMGIAIFNVLKPPYLKLKYALLAIFIVCNLYAQLNFTLKSTGEFTGGLNEVPRASALKINRQFAELATTKLEVGQSYISDTSNLVLAKFEALYTIGKQVIFPSRDFFIMISNVHPIGDLIGVLKNDFELYKENAGGYKFSELYEIDYGKYHNAFFFPRYLTTGFNQSKMIVTNQKQTILNSYYSKPATEKYFDVTQPKNQLLFIHSKLGAHYYSYDRKIVSFYQLEDDPMFAGQQFSGFGEHALFTAFNPTPKAHILMEATNTVMKQFDAELPKPQIIGKNTVSLNFVGRGTGRVVSASVDFLKFHNMDLFAFDANRPPKQFLYNRSGLMNLYGRDVNLDNRWLTTFSRDISLISDEEYKNFKPPSALQKFPADLANKQLEYSGIYEDGWISEQSFFMLTPTANSQKFMLKGVVPLIDNPDYKETITIKIAGKVRATQELKVGEFMVEIPLTKTERQQVKLRVDIEFNKFQLLTSKNPFAAQDGRITGGLIHYLGFSDEPLSSTAENRDFQPPTAIKTFPTDLENGQLEYAGIYKDGWVADHAFIVLAPSKTSQKFVFKGKEPNLSGQDFITAATIKIDGQTRVTQDIKPGEFELEIPLTDAERARKKLRIDLEFSKTQRLKSRNPFAAQDGRVTGGLINYLGFSDEPTSNATTPER